MLSQSVHTPLPRALLTHVLSVADNFCFLSLAFAAPPVSKSYLGFRSLWKPLHWAFGLGFYSNHLLTIVHVLNQTRVQQERMWPLKL